MSGLFGRRGGWCNGDQLSLYVLLFLRMSTTGLTAQAYGAKILRH